MNKHTLGIVADLHDKSGVILLREIARIADDAQFCNLLELANASEKRFLVFAGAFNGEGFFAVMFDDEAHLATVVRVASERVKETGASINSWLAQPHALYDFTNEGANHA